MDPYAWFHPLFILPISGIPLGTALHSHATRSSYPGADNGAQVPPFSRHWSAKWWYSGAEAKRPTHPICVVSHRFRNRGHDHLGPHDFRCAASRRFRNHGHDCLGPRDFCCAVTAHGELQRVIVPQGVPSITTSHADRVSSRVR
jgi:hypothetical protein